MNKGAEVNKENANKRQETYYIVYASLGPARSLKRLQTTLSDLGIEISMNTLKSYSFRYGWQDKIAALDEKPSGLATIATEIDERHASIARAAQALAMEAFDRLNPGDMSASDAARLMKIGIDIERLAVGLHTEKKEIVVNILNPIIEACVMAFSEVNSIDDPNERAAQWAHRADALLTTFLPDDLINNLGNLK